MTTEADSKRDFLRHALATIAYRGGKALREVPPSFAELRAAPDSRTPIQILAHMGDVLAWALSIVDGEQAFSVSKPISWDQETDRFYEILELLDAALQRQTDQDLPAAQLFQGPFADTLTHIGQLAMLRRLAGSPVKGENYFEATVVEGHVGRKQVEPAYEFD